MRGPAEHTTRKPNRSELVDWVRPPGSRLHRCQRIGQHRPSGITLGACGSSAGDNRGIAVGTTAGQAFPVASVDRVLLHPATRARFADLQVPR
jgi:hypothetical protein